MSLSIWSIHDISAGRRAIKLINLYGGKVNLGLRPYDYPEENATWLPDLNSSHYCDNVELIAKEEDGIRELTIRPRVGASTIWALIINGQVVGVRMGQLSEGDLEEFIFQTFGINPKPIDILSSDQ